VMCINGICHMTDMDDISSAMMCVHDMCDDVCRSCVMCVDDTR